MGMVCPYGSKRRRQVSSLCTYMMDWWYTLAAESPNRPTSYARDRKEREREFSWRGVRVIVHTSWAPPEIQLRDRQPNSIPAQRIPRAPQPMSFEISIFPWAHRTQSSLLLAPRSPKAHSRAPHAARYAITTIGTNRHWLVGPGSPGQVTIL